MAARRRQTIIVYRKCH
ncbi:hypothetical protein [Alicyclobacillus mengziensis]